jgi:hypothetical protein
LGTDRRNIEGGRAARKDDGVAWDGATAMREAELREPTDRVLIGSLPRSLREAIRDAVARGGNKRAIMQRAKAQGAGRLPLAAIGACVDEALRDFA